MKLPDDDKCPNDAKPIARIGVPGGRAIDHRSEFTEFFSWYGTAFQAGCTSPSAILHFFLWGGIFFALSPVVAPKGLEKTCTISGNLISAITFLTTFAIGTYMGNVLGRFHERFNNCCKTNGNLTLVSLLSGAQLAGDKPRVATLLRYANLMMHMYYSICLGGLGPDRWEMFRNRCLVTPFEEEKLAPLKKKPSAVFVWCQRIVIELNREGKLSDIHAQRIEECISGLRGLAAKQIAYQLTPPSYTYFHLMMLMIHIFLLCLEWNSAVRMYDKFHLSPVPWTAAIKVSLMVELVGMVLLIAMLNTLATIARWLSNPYGDDETDYDLDFDLRGLWEESVETVKNMADDKKPDIAAEALTEAKASLDPFLMIHEKHRAAAGKTSGGFFKK
jgi:hypothetical protein